MGTERETGIWKRCIRETATLTISQARIDHQRRLEDAREKHKEWWNLDESGRTLGKKAETVNEEGLRRKEENRVDDRGVTRGGVYGSR